MNEKILRELLVQLSAGRIGVDDAVSKLRHLPFEQMGFATLDHHRGIRCGFPEVIYCAGKTVAQSVEIFGRLACSGVNVLATRATPEVFHAVRRKHRKAEYNELARAITLRQTPCEPAGHIAIV
ncbi:MAG: 1-(5-phosphoribosyl)-5-amino-4-imidazole-carboxylate carboxylase, partial [Planctomycetaceae bacterium]